MHCIDVAPWVTLAWPMMVLASLYHISEFAGVLNVNSTGFTSPLLDDMALVLYVTVQNDGWQSVRNVTARAGQCCLIYNNERECTSLPVIGDQLILLNPGEQRNLTLIYPTIYPYDRAGHCEVNIHYDRMSSPLTTTVRFNTSLENRVWIKQPLLKSYLDRSWPCDSVDEDRLGDCQPVDCIEKYHGRRNYFNTTSKRCDKPTECVSNPRLNIPDKAFDRRKNTCNDLMMHLSASDINFFQNAEDTSPSSQSDISLLYQFVCVHGKPNHDGKGCDCYSGWTSASGTEFYYDPTSHIITMCNVRDATYLHSSLHYRVLIGVGALTGVCVIVMVGFLLVLACNYSFKSHVDSMGATYNPANQNLPSFTTMHNTVNAPPKHASVFRYAKVHTANHPVLDCDLKLTVGDVITNLSRSDDPAIWMGTCNELCGTFHVSCAQFFIKDPDN